MKRKLLILLIIVLGVIVFSYQCLPIVDVTKLDGPYEVLRVVDGDTIGVEIEGEYTRIRFIGINAPEDDGVDEDGKEATEFLTDLLRNNEVYFQYDEELLDQYGRTLAYVYLADGTNVNFAIVDAGYASPMTVEPNDKYASLIYLHYLVARVSRKGQWQ